MQLFSTPLAQSKTGTSGATSQQGQLSFQQLQPLFQQPTRDKPNGKAPPVDQFSGDNVEKRFEDWIQNFERAVQWNRWSEEEALIQLAGHLRGRAKIEWNLLSTEDKQAYVRAND